jgi:hypothetical protein
MQAKNMPSQDRNEVLQVQSRMLREQTRKLLKIESMPQIEQPLEKSSLASA